MSSILKVDTIQDQSGNNIINESGNVITIGASGDTITVPAGATVSGFTSAGIDDNATSVAITIDSSENVGIGTASPDTLLSLEKNNAPAIQFKDTSGATDEKVWRLNGLNDAYRIQTWNDALNSNQVAYQILRSGVDVQNHRFYTEDSERMRLTTTGLGIGVSAPQSKLHIIQTAETIDDGIKIVGSSSPVSGRIYMNSTDIHIDNATAGQNTGITLDTSGKIGIGTASPVTPLNVIGGSDLGIEVSDTSSGGNGVITIKGNATNGGSYLQFGDTDDDNVGRVYYTHNDNAMKFNTADAERMRIDSSGNLFVAKTSAAYQTVGHELLASGRAFHTASGGKALSLVRLSSDGAIVDFYKDGTEVGSIGVVNNDNPFFQGNATNHGGLQCGTNAILPVKNSANSDNTINLGQADIRWKDIYLSGGAYIGGTSTPNKLDDYEEGTWTPAYRGASSAGSYSTNASGTYTKVGNLVSVTAHLKNITQNSAGSGSIQIAGLPFAKSSSQESDIGSIYLNLFSLGGSDKYAIVNVNPSASVVLITAIDSDGASASTLQLSARQSDSADMFFSITYTT